MIEPDASYEKEKLDNATKINAFSELKKNPSEAIGFNINLPPESLVGTLLDRKKIQPILSSLLKQHQENSSKEINKVFDSYQKEFQNLFAKSIREHNENNPNSLFNQYKRLNQVKEDSLAIANKSVNDFYNDITELIKSGNVCHQEVLNAIKESNSNAEKRSKDDYTLNKKQYNVGKITLLLTFATFVMACLGMYIAHAY